MSKPRNKWWGYAINCVKAYPALKEKYQDMKAQKITATYSSTPGGGGDGRAIERLAMRELPCQEQREYEAVHNAIEATMLYDTGEERVKLISLVYFGKQRINLDAAGYQLHIAEATAKRWHGDFIRQVGGYLGLTN